MIYLDYNATTPVAPEVLKAMERYWTDHWGNPSGVYGFGQELRPRMGEARASVASLIGARTQEVVFTSGGTESNNLAFHCALGGSRRHLILSSVEHSSVDRLADSFQDRGFDVTRIPVDGRGRLDLAALERSMRGETALVSIMWGNNETGVMFPVDEIGRMCRERGILFHTDAIQAAGKVPLDVDRASADYLSLSGHKLYAPKGVGALYVRQGAPFRPLVIGGTQEGGRRGGTQNVAFMAALGVAADLARSRLEEDARRESALRDRLEEALLALPGVRCNGREEERLPNTTSLAFEGVEAEALLLLLDKAGICASAGSACMSGSVEPSRVLLAMGLPRARALGSIRLSLGRETTAEEVDRVVETMPGLLLRLRGREWRSRG